MVEFPVLAMRSRLRKKAMGSQIDWAISLGIFIVFTFWFFIVLRHYTISELQMESQTSDLVDVFRERIEFNYSEIPVFVEARSDMENVPIMVRNPSDWDNFVLEDDIYSVQDDENMIFIADLEEGVNRFVMRTSDSEYDIPHPLNFLSKSGNTVSVPGQSYNVRYPDNILNEVFYRGQQQVYDFNIRVNDNVVDIENSSEYVPGIFAEHNMTTEQFNLRNYIFADNTYMMNTFDVRGVVGSNTTFGLEFKTPVYEEYYMDTIVSYSFDQDSDCEEINSSVLDLVSDGETGMTFFFDEDISFEVCDISSFVDGERMTVTANIEYDPTATSSTTSFMVHSHNSSYPEIADDIISINDISVGIPERFMGISRSKLINLNTKSFADLLELWNITSDDEYRIEVYDREGETLFEFQTSNPSQADVFSRTVGDYMINQYGEREFVYININMW